MIIPRVGDNILLPDQHSGETFDVVLSESRGVGRLMAVTDFNTGAYLGLVMLTTDGSWYWVRRDEPADPWAASSEAWRG